MPAPSRMQIAKADILAHFDSLPFKLFRKGDIRRVMAEQRDFWRLAQRANTDELIAFLAKHGELRNFRIEFPSRPAEIFVWGDSTPLLEILQFSRPRSHYSHYTALRFHGLTEQVPKTIYLTEEPHATQKRHSDLSQSAVDAAFKKPVRVSQNMAVLNDLRICILNGSGEIGIIEGEMHEGERRPARIRVTNLERTLIDATVRPAYAGGVSEVLKAFQNARQSVSVNRLRALLQKLDFLYPYHQAIGFYLQRAGFSATAVKLFRELPQQFDFYLAHEMGATDYISEWRLHVPRGF